MNENLSKKSDTTSAIGESIVIAGDITGQENITLNCTVEGSINFKNNDLVIGENGRINANIDAKNIIVEGDVKGELRAIDQIVLKQTGRVNGDIKAPRVVLDDGCQFRGSIDMEEKHSGETRHSNLQLANSKGITTHPIKTGKKPRK